MSMRSVLWSSAIRAELGIGAVQFGVIVLTTSAGIMDHEEARRKKVGGKVRIFDTWGKASVRLVRGCC